MNFNSVNTKLCIGILVSISVITYTRLTKVDLEDIDYYNGKLDNTMIVRSHGGEMNYEFINFSLDGSDNVLSIRGCAFFNIDLNGTLKLKIGDHLKVGVIPFRNSQKFRVISLESKYSNLLSLESYSYCDSNSLVGVFYFLYFFSLILIVRLIIKFVKGDGMASVLSWFKRDDGVT